MNGVKAKHLLLLALLAIILLITPIGVSYAADFSSASPSTYFAQPVFSDIRGHWAEKYIENAIAEGYIKGYTDGTFKPNDAVTRAEFVAMVNGALQLRDDNVVNLVYGDVKATDWFYKDIQKACYVKYADGISKTSFEPSTNIQREEAAAMIARFIPKIGFQNDISVTSFPDAESISDWAEQALAVIINKGYMKGDNLGYLLPQEKLTRAEAVKIIGEVLENETIIRQDVSVSAVNSILKDKIYVGDINIGKALGDEVAELKNISALSKLYINCPDSTVKITDSLIIQLNVIEAGAYGRVFSEGSNQIHLAILFNGINLTANDGSLAKPWDKGYENIIYVIGSVDSEIAIIIADQIGSMCDSTGTLTLEQVDSGAKAVLPSYTATTGYDGSFIINKQESAVSTVGKRSNKGHEHLIPTHTISFTEDGGSEVNDVTQNYSTTIDEEPSTTKAGFTFDGWYAEPELTSKVSFPYTIVSDATMYAKWTILEYTITCVTDGTPNVILITSSAGENATIPNPYDMDFVKAGYIPGAWYFDEAYELTNESLSEYYLTMPAYDITIYFKWLEMPHK